MPRHTTTIKILPIRINDRRLEQLERVVDYAFKQGRQLDPLSSNTVWYMLDRWDSVLKLLEKMERQKNQLVEDLGALK